MAGCGDGVADSVDGLLDALGDCASCAVGFGWSLAVVGSESDCGDEMPGDRVYLAAGFGRAVRIAEPKSMIGCPRKTRKGTEMKAFDECRPSPNWRDGLFFTSPSFRDLQCIPWTSHCRFQVELFGFSQLSCRLRLQPA
jgi:hypothetical protein